MQPLKIGLLGAAKIAPYAILAPARATGVAQIVSVAARDPVRAAAFAGANGIPGVAEDYEALIDDPEVEAIYNALPPSRHADLTIKALRAGKAVLCEKPFSLGREDAAGMVAAAEETGVVLMEAMHARYHPQMARAVEIVAAGEIGSLKTITAVYDSPISETPGEFRFIPALGGGALLDTGTYCLMWCRLFGGPGAQVISARAEIGATGVDDTTWAELAWPSGVTAQVRCSIRRPLAVALELVGETGTLSISNPVAPQFYPGVITVNGREEPVTDEATYNFQLRAFVAAVREGQAPLMTAADSLEQMALIQSIREAALTVGETP